jgi:hypothetical protein
MYGMFRPITAITRYTLFLQGPLLGLGLSFSVSGFYTQMVVLLRKVSTYKQDNTNTE